MRRSLSVTVLALVAGTAVPLISAGPAAAAPSCQENFAARLGCWKQLIGPHGRVVVELRDPLPYEDDGAGDQRNLAKELRKDSDKFVVQVPEGVHTGPGGTVLLVLAGGRFVDPGATIDRLPEGAEGYLADAGACEPAQLCELLRFDGKDGKPLTGAQLIEKKAVADRSTQAGGLGPTVTASAASDEGRAGGSTGKGDGREERTEADGEAAGLGTTSTAVLFMSTLLVLLLAAMAFLVRRSRGPVAVGHRRTGAPGPRSASAGSSTGSSGRGEGAAARTSRSESAAARTTGSEAGSVRSAGPDRGESGPRRAPSEQSTRSAPSEQGTRSAPSGPGPRGAPPERDPRPTTDETTTRLRVGSPRRHGPQAGARTGPSRTAVVRTELHPQGYVEFDRVLYRAVWAEPDRPPPAPGGLVDVTEPRDPDSGVLHAFPPSGGRHAAKGNRPHPG
jgi:hypothetical protein